MATYRNIVTGEVRDLEPALIDSWRAAGNPKADQWEAYTPPIPPPPGPAADWIGFDIAIQSEPEIVATINDLGRLSQVATLSLGHALEEAEKGNLDRFLPIWQEWIIAASPPAAALERFRVLAAQHHLPAEFQAAIAAPPAGPAVAP